MVRLKLIPGMERSDIAAIEYAWFMEIVRRDNFGVIEPCQRASLGGLTAPWNALHHETYRSVHEGYS